MIMQKMNRITSIKISQYLVITCQFLIISAQEVHTGRKNLVHWVQLKIKVLMILRKFLNKFLNICGILLTRNQALLKVCQIQIANLVDRPHKRLKIRIKIRNL